MWIARAAVMAGALSALPVSAQFFQQMFTQGNAFQSHEQEAHSVGDASWFHERHLCSDTLACVSEPNECPCPFAEQTRCVLGDGYVCTQTADCAVVENLYRHP